MIKLKSSVINLFCFCWFFGFNYYFSQPTKVAILDFENTSGKAEYDALGKAMSSMLITDLSNNIHPKKVEFFERTQLNKLLDEQKLQKSKNFDAKTAVDFGKLSGVNYVFVGSVFVMDGNCNITSKLVDVQTSKIVLSKEANGKIETWLQLKSQLAEAIAQQLNNPVTLDPNYRDQTTPLATLNQYGKVLSSMDQGDADKAEQMRSLFEETNPDFKYFVDLKADIEQLKQRISEIENVTDVLTNAFELGDKAEMKGDYKSSVKYFEKFISNPGTEGNVENKTLYALGKMAKSFFKLNDYSNSLKYSEKACQIYKYYPESNEIRFLSLVKLNLKEESNSIFNFIIDSLNIQNEIIFKNKKINNKLVWSSIDGFSFGLLPFENSEEWCYTGITDNGYGSPIRNYLTIINSLKEHKIQFDENQYTAQIYKKKENQILDKKSEEVFSCDQILNFYKLSNLYAKNIYNDLPAYKNHLEKEIKRMENYGSYIIDGKRVFLNQINIEKSEELEKKIRDNRKFLKEIGLTNSREEMEVSLPLIYGEFMFNYLIVLIKLELYSEATSLYQEILKNTVKKRDTYFYNENWDILLGFRKINDDVSSRSKLNQLEFEKKLETRLEKELDNRNLYLMIINKLKTKQLNLTQSSEIQVDETIKQKGMRWSKNFDLLKDGKGNEFKYARNEEDMNQFYKDGVAAYCYYDFEESNNNKYGKLYNFFALKQLLNNPYSNWKIANQADYFKFIQLDKNMSSYSEYEIENILLKNKILDLELIKSGSSGGNGGFCCIDQEASFWTGEIGKSYLENNKKIESWKIIKFNQNNAMSFHNYNCPQCYFSIRLVQVVNTPETNPFEKETQVCTDPDKKPYYNEINSWTKIALNEIMQDFNTLELGIHGEIKFEFIVELNGSVSQLRLVNNATGSEYLANQLALKIKNMKDWFPGLKNNVKVRCFNEIVFNF